MFKRNYSFLHYCQLFCRYVMLQKRILSKPKWGAQAAARGGGRTPPPPPPPPNSDGTAISSTASIRVLEASE